VTTPGHSTPLTEDEVAADPFVQFGRWFDEARRAVRAAEAMAVATASPGGQPSVRMVLMKSWDEHGFVFHTNYASRKALEIEQNPQVAALFHWDPLGRQVRIEGAAARVSAAESDAHFAQRPRGAQIGAHASWQSRPIAERAELDRRVQELEQRFAGEPVPRPAWWGGIRIRPHVVEFWQNRDDRLHDRLVYLRAQGPAPGEPGAIDEDATARRWLIERLQP
jgi:pyridoxamine 5'-phosphate oxidase